MDVARGLRVRGLHAGGELPDQRDRQVPGAVGRLTQRGEIDKRIPAGVDHRRDGRLGHRPAGGLARIAASKSSIPCTRCASLNQAVSGLLRIIGVSKLILAP